MTSVGPGSRLWRRHRGQCHYCSIELVPACEANQNEPRKATLDHIQPRANGGADHLRNIVLACQRCNQLKGEMPYYDFWRKLPELRALGLLDPIVSMVGARRLGIPPSYRKRIRAILREMEALENFQRETLAA